MSIKPIGRIVPTSIEENCEALSGAARSSCRMKQSFFDSIPTRR
jgi:hypothetical protein